MRNEIKDERERNERKKKNMTQKFLKKRIN
jgi:hypothetical protein